MQLLAAITRTWAEWKHRQVLLILERESDHEDYCLADVSSKQVERERLDVVERTPALADGGNCDTVLCTMSEPARRSYH